MNKVIALACVGLLLFGVLCAGCSQRTAVVPIVTAPSPVAAAPAPAPAAPLVLSTPPPPTPAQQKAQATAAYDARAQAYQRTMGGTTPPSAVDAYRQKHFLAPAAPAASPQMMTPQDQRRIDMAARNAVMGMQSDAAVGRRRTTIPPGGTVVITTETDP